MRDPARGLQRREGRRRPRGVRGPRGRAHGSQRVALVGPSRLVVPGDRVSRDNPAIGAGYVGILSVELHFPEAGSLKGKRKHVKSAKAQLQNRFGASVAEVDHHDLWQRSRLAMSCAAREMGELHALLDSAERWLHGQDWVVAGVARRIVSLDD